MASIFEMMQRAADAGGANERAVAAQMAELNAENAANAVRLAAHDPAPFDPIPADEVATLRSRIAALETERDNLRLCVGELLEARDCGNILNSLIRQPGPDDHTDPTTYTWRSFGTGANPAPATPGSTAPDDSRGSDKEWRLLAHGQPAIAEPKPALPARALGPQHQTVGNGGRLTGLWR